MPTNTLSDARCRAAKASSKPQKLFDGGGLHLYVTTTGVKVWRLAYRLAGKPKTKSLGEYPALGLAEARIKRDQDKATLRDGGDPMAGRQSSTSTITLRAGVAGYWAGRQDVSEDYRSNAIKGITTHLAKLLDRPMSSITRQDLLAELMVMNAAGLFDYVRKVRMWVGQVFDWAIEQGKCQINPAALIKPEKAFGKALVESHAALPAAEVGPFLQRVALEGQLQSTLALLMLAYTWVRTGELRKMKWPQIEGDLWRVPKEAMKRRREHLVPLPAQAVKLLKVLRDRTQSEYVFPSDRRLDRAMSENSILYLIHRCGYKGRMTGHGWRTVASTWANENGYNRDAIERQLAHAPDDEIRAAYNQAEYLPERRRMLQAWADWLDLQNADAGGAQG